MISCTLMFSLLSQLSNNLNYNCYLKWHIHNIMIREGHIGGLQVTYAETCFDKSLQILTFVYWDSVRHFVIVVCHYDRRFIIYVCLLLLHCDFCAQRKLWVPVVWAISSRFFHRQKVIMKFEKLTWPLVPWPVLIRMLGSFQYSTFVKNDTT